MNGFGIGAILFLAIFYILFFAVAILMYVLNSLALFKLAKKRGIQNYALAWVPIGSTWILGKLADDVNVCRRNKKTSFAKNLLLLEVVYIGLFIITYIAAISFGIAFAMQKGAVGFSASVAPLVTALVGLVGLAVIALAIAINVLFYMALYRIFYGYDENNAVVFLVLSIFVPYVQPILLFIMRNRELLPPDPSTFIQNGFPEYPNMYTNNFENNSNTEDNTNE